MRESRCSYEKDQSQPLWDEGSLREIIQQGDTKKLNEVCSKLGKYYAKNGLSTSQIRNIFDKIQAMHEYNERELLLLIPKLAYVAGRHERSTPIIKKDLFPLVEKTISLVDKGNFQNFKNFFEAIVAYHRYWGGKI